MTLGTQKQHKGCQEQQRCTLKDNAPAHQPVGSVRIGVALRHSNHPGDQHPERSQHQQPDDNNKKSAHGYRIGADVPFCTPCPPRLSFGLPRPWPISFDD